MRGNHKRCIHRDEREVRRDREIGIEIDREKRECIQKPLVLYIQTHTHMSQIAYNRIQIH